MNASSYRLDTRSRADASNESKWEATNQPRGRLGQWGKALEDLRKKDENVQTGGDGTTNGGK